MLAAGKIGPASPYPSRRYIVPDNAAKVLVTAIGTEETAQMEMIAAIAYNLLAGESESLPPYLLISNAFLVNQCQKISGRIIFRKDRHYLISEGIKKKEFRVLPRIIL